MLAGGSDAARRAAMEYARKWNIEGVIEDALTTVLYAHPDDPMGMLCEEFQKKAAPEVLHSIAALEILRGSSASLEVEVHGIVGGKPSVAGRAIAPSMDGCEMVQLTDSSSTRYLGRGVRGAMAAVESVLQPALAGRPLEQRSLDEALLGALSQIGANTALAASAAIAICAAKVFREPLWLYLARSLGCARGAYTLPKVVCQAFAPAGGLVSVVGLLPTGPMGEGMRVLSEISCHYQRAMKVNASRAGLLPLDSRTCDETLGAVEIAVTGAGHQLGGDVMVGLFGSADRVNEFVCYLQGDMGSKPRDDIVWASFVAPAKMGECKADALVVRAPSCATLTRLAGLCEKAREAEKKLVLQCSSEETCDSWLADLAVALGVDYLVLGPLVLAEHAAKYVRLVEIERELNELAA